MIEGGLQKKTLAVTLLSLSALPKLGRQVQSWPYWLWPPGHLTFVLYCISNAHNHYCT